MLPKPVIIAIIISVVVVVIVAVVIMRKKATDLPPVSDLPPASLPLASLPPASDPLPSAQQDSLPTTVVPVPVITQITCESDPDKWYYDHNPDVAAAKMVARTHYCYYGKNEGRLGCFGDCNVTTTKDAACLADPAKWYLDHYPDVAAAGVDPKGHYCTYGKNEYRLGCFNCQ